jgi:hypothetical protein
MKVVPVTFLPLKLTREIQFAGARGSIPRHGNFFCLFVLPFFSRYLSRETITGFRQIFFGFAEGFL